MNDAKHLVDEIDRLLSWLRIDIESDESRGMGMIPEDEIPQFDSMDTRIYTLAFNLGLKEALPSKHDLNQSLDFPELKQRVQYRGGTNLPFDYMRDRSLKHYAEIDWKDQMLRLRQLAVSKSESGQTKTSPPSPLETDTQRAILNIARLPNKEVSLDEKARRIMAIDRATAGWKSEGWATLFGCSESRIRQLPFWKDLQAARNRLD